MTLIYVLLMFLQLFADTTNGDRILGLFIHTGGSHFYSFYPIMKALAEKGHNITVLSYFKVKNPHPLYNELVIEGEPVINSTLEFKNMVRLLLKCFFSIFCLYVIMKFRSINY